MRLRSGLSIFALLAAHPACATNAKLEAVLKTFAAISGDSTRLKTYCDLTAAVAAGDSANADSLVKALGPDFATAWAIRSHVSRDSIEGMELNATVIALDAKCASLSLPIGDDRSD